MADKKIGGIENAPEILVDGYQGVSITNGVVKINFFTTRVVPNTTEHIQQIALVLDMSPGTLLQVQEALTNLVKELEKSKVIVRVEANVIKS